MFVIIFTAIIVLGLFLLSVFDNEEIGIFFVVLGVVGILIVLCIAIFGEVSHMKKSQKVTNTINEQKLDSEYYDMIYNKFIKKFNLTPQQFKRIKNESKSQLVKRIRLFLKQDSVEPVTVTYTVVKNKQLENKEPPKIENPKVKKSNINFEFQNNW